MSFDTLILSAGRSSRMGQPKALLQYDGKTLLEHIVYRASQCTPGQVVIVCGHTDTASTLTQKMALSIARPILDSVVVVEGKSDGQPIDSIRCGLNVLPTPKRLLLWPVDMVFGSLNLVGRLSSSFLEDDDKIARPIYDRKHGHPVLFGKQARYELGTALADQGAHHVVHRNSKRLIDIEYGDKRIIQAMNTPQEARLCGVSI